MRIGEKTGLDGGTFIPEDPLHSFRELNQELDCNQIRKANTMMEFVAWCPSAKKKHSLSICSMPVERNFTGPLAEYRGNLYVLRCVGEVMSKSDGCIAGIIFDNALGHTYVKKLLHGQTDGLPMEEIKQVPFFRELSWGDLPPHTLPRLPIAIAYILETRGDLGPPWHLCLVPQIVVLFLVAHGSLSCLFATFVSQDILTWC